MERGLCGGWAQRYCSDDGSSTLARDRYAARTCAHAFCALKPCFVCGVRVLSTDRQTTETQTTQDAAGGRPRRLHAPCACDATPFWSFRHTTAGASGLPGRFSLELRHLVVPLYQPVTLSFALEVSRSGAQARHTCSQQTSSTRLPKENIRASAQPSPTRVSDPVSWGVFCFARSRSPPPPFLFSCLV